MSEDRGEGAGALADTDAPAASAEVAGMARALGAERKAGPGPAEAQRILQRLTTVTDILRGWVWETDAEHRFIYMSDSVERFAGQPPEWHYGKTRQELGNLSIDKQEHQRYLRQLEAHEMFGPIEFVRYQNGRQLWMRTIGLPQFGADGTFTGYCGVAFDISAEVEARQGNRRAEVRRRVARSATIADHMAPTPIPCVVLDISQGGARLDVPEAADVPGVFKLVIDLEGTEHTCEVVWRKVSSVGVRFRQPA